MSESKWYVVYRGKNVGVYDNWQDCKRDTEGFPGAKFASFRTYEEAKRSFLEECICGGKETEWVQRIFPAMCTGSPSNDTWRTCESGPSLPCYCTDAACSNPAGGIVEFKCVRLTTKMAPVLSVFSYGPFELGSNNIGEYVGLVRALMWTASHNALDAIPVYTDSRVAISWVSNPVTPGSNTRLHRIGQDLKGELHICDDWIKSPDGRREVAKRVRHWNTLLWGEIPADYGRK